MKVIELFSGIGGMHLAFKASCKLGEVVLAVDINPVANEIYRINFPEVQLLNRNIQSLTAEFLNKQGADTILMSPPCQPFTRNGLKGDSEDPRTTAFLHIMDILPELNVTQILIENVKGFETSKMRNILLETLKTCDFCFQEFLLCPTQFGIPNSRLRYYCIAKKTPKVFTFQINALLFDLPGRIDKLECFEIGSIVEFLEKEEKYAVPMKILEKYYKLLDICYLNSRRSCCFTKAYGRYAEGTGSVLTPIDEPECQVIFQDILEQQNDEDIKNKLESLQLRYFTPREISRLQCFPENYTFPDKVTDRQKYMVLGNSININVVSELIKLLD